MFVAIIIAAQSQSTRSAIRLYVWYVYVREIGGVAVGGHQVRTCVGVGLGLCEPS